MALTDADRLQMTALALMKYSTVSTSSSSSGGSSGFKFVKPKEILEVASTITKYFATITEM